MYELSEKQAMVCRKIHFNHRSTISLCSCWHVVCIKCSGDYCAYFFWDHKFTAMCLAYSDVFWLFLTLRVKFIFCWPCISIYVCNKNQLFALFILSLFRQSTSTCFGRICSPSSGGILYIYNNWYVLCFLVDCLLAWPTDSQLKRTPDS
jgi:hypothetical protein